MSAFLVTCREMVQEYEYVCFIHDKKENSEDRINLVKQWNYSLWENILANAIFIKNILYIFEKHEELGLLSPAPLISDNCMHGYKNTWSVNYDNTCELLKNLGVECVPDADIPPHTIGTVFWVRPKAIDKLLKKDWKYEDFDEEPLAIDGTISHAIERC